MAGERIERAAYSVRDLQQLYGISKRKIFEEKKAGRLVGHLLGARTLRFLRADVDRWVETWSGPQTNGAMIDGNF